MIDRLCDRVSISFSKVGKCRSMSIVVLAAILYTRSQYVFLSLLESQLGHNSNKGLIEEYLMWKQVRTDLLNGSRWYGAQGGLLRMEKILSHTNASSRRWAGVYSSPHLMLRISEDLSGWGPETHKWEGSNSAQQILVESSTKRFVIVRRKKDTHPGR